MDTHPKSLTSLWASYLEGDLYDVVIVGSGYGGAMAAATLADSQVLDHNGRLRPARVCILERGKAYRQGEFPSRFSELPAHLRVGRQNTGSLGGKPEGLFDLRLGDDVVALVANGFGGGSLINAGVLMAPDVNDFSGPWQAVLQDLQTHGHFDAARRELGGVAWQNELEQANTIALHPEWSSNNPLAKTAALQTLAGGLPFQHTTLSVSMNDGPNHAGVHLDACTLCGDCMTGCNVGAKDSLDVNLLHKALRGGAEAYTGASVLSLKRSPPGGAGHWELKVVHTDPHLQAREAGPLVLRARHVILAAGTLGSTEILLRSRGHRLALSARLGEGFSCNGDNIAAVHGMPQPTQGAADEDSPLTGRHVGPTITASVEVTGLRKKFQLQEFSVPGPTRRFFEEIVTTARALNDLPSADTSEHHDDPQATDPLAVSAYDMGHTLLVGVIGHDDANGSLRLPLPLGLRQDMPQPGTLNITWKNARDGCELDFAHAQLEALAAGVGAEGGEGGEAKVVANPMWRLLPTGLEELISQPRGPVLTVHPLGGCAIGRSAEDGVVNDYGQVFDASAGASEWFGSLAVLDGAIIPGSLGVNPALTIAALARRAAQALQAQWLQPPAAPPHEGQLRGPPRPRNRLGATLPPPGGANGTQVEVIERLSGPVWLHVGHTLPRRYQVELSLAFEPAALSTLTAPQPKLLVVNPQHPQTRLRLYLHDDWEQHDLRVKDDGTRRDHLLLEAELSGSLRFLHREPSTSWRRRLRSSLGAWVWNRGLRDTWQYLFDDTSVPRGLGQRQGPLGRLASMWRLASRAGEVRRFDYALQVGTVLTHQWLDDKGQKIDLGLIEGQPVTGHKRITYNRRANPWHQLTQMTLTALPALHVENSFPVLKLDPRHLARIGVPLLRVVDQRDHASALADLTSFGLYLARVLLHTHLWTFRKPDAGPLPEPNRLPGPIAGLPEPHITELVVGRMPQGGRPVRVRLTRYAPLADRGLPPLVMIHGYSVSGNTFTHPSLAPSAAEYFWRQGRDVWVVDVRTSTGLDTANHPWSMEGVALVDIPAALMHIRSATQRRVDVFAHCIGCVMLSMAVLADAKEIAEGTMELGVGTWLTSAELAQLQAFNGAAPAGGPHPCIERIVLSQKGPVLRYTDDNVFRAFLLQSVRRWLLADTYQFRPPSEPTVSDQLLDRLLASLPYPDADYDVENPLRFWKRTPWTASRHRMDALYGRDFNAAAMSDATLHAIDDLFGPIHLDTVAQTIHFARFNAITNQSGRGEFVTLKRVRERWGGIATLALHGQDNGLADESTQRLLSTLLGDQCGVNFRSTTHAGMGHQDVLIGTASARVFDDIEAFLATPVSVAAPPAFPQRFGFDLPWIGPRLSWPDAADADPRIACMPRPDQGLASLILLPGRMTSTPGDPVPSFEAVDWPAGVAMSTTHGSSSEWLTATPPLTHLGTIPDGPAGFGWFALLVYLQEETALEPAPSHTPGAAADDDRTSFGPGFLPPITERLAQWHPHRIVFPTLAGGLPAWMQPVALAGWAGGAVAPPPASEPTLSQAVTEWLRSQPAEVLQRCFVQLDDVWRMAQNLAPAASTPEPLRIALASCQYPPGLVDAPVASASLKALGAEPYIDLTLFVGDQIYADATAGLADPVRPDERFEQPNEKALRVRALRNVLRRMPSQMLLDDHELSDNWEPMPDDAVGGTHRARQVKRRGLAAFHHYQRMGLKTSHSDRLADLQFSFAGHPFFMADARTGRSARARSLQAGDQHILRCEQWFALTNWLTDHKDQVKFIATPSLMLPRRRTTGEDPQNGVHSDAWDGFPASLDRLLSYIAHNQIRHTVFVSGDEHHSLYAEAWLTPLDGRPRVKVVSVHSSALYAPFPFANGKPQDFRVNDAFEVSAAQVTVQTHFAPAGDGYAVLCPITTPTGPVLNIEFKNGDASLPPALVHPVGLG